MYFRPLHKAVSTFSHYLNSNYWVIGMCYAVLYLLHLDKGDHIKFWVHSPHGMPNITCLVFEKEFERTMNMLSSLTAEIC